MLGSLESLHRWLATTEDDRQIRRRLKVLAAGGESTNYTVTTYTSDIKVCARVLVFAILFVAPTPATSRWVHVLLYLLFCLSLCVCFCGLGHPQAPLSWVSGSVQLSWCKQGDDGVLLLSRMMETHSWLAFFLNSVTRQAKPFAIVCCRSSLGSSQVLQNSTTSIVKSEPLHPESLNPSISPVLPKNLLKTATATT